MRSGEMRELVNPNFCSCGGRVLARTPKADHLKCSQCDTRYNWDDIRNVCPSWEEFYRIKQNCICRVTEWRNERGPIR